MGNVNSSASSTASQVQSSADSQAIVVSAQRLWSDYQQNEVAADELYRGRLLLIGGRLESINKNFVDAAGLSPGERVYLSCTGSGLIVGIPTLENCELRNGEKFDAQTRRMLGG